ncbi:MAG: GDP-mannose 4,6-dehydratase [archaeon]
MQKRTNETILVTGAAGFIGSHSVQELLKRGNLVIGIDNLNDYYDPKIKEENVKRISCNNFILYKKDIRDSASLKEIFEKHRPKKIIHLAAMAGVRRSILEPLLYFDVNVNGTIALLELAKEHQIENFVYASSSSVYGNNNKIPFNENDETALQVSPYAASKKCGEVICKSYSQTFGLNITALRFFTVYGPSGRPDMAPYKFTDLIFKGRPIEMYGDGNSLRDYTYISDIVSGVISACEHNYKFEIINLGDSNPVKLKDFIGIIEKNLGKKADIITKPMPKGDVDRTFADITKAKKLLSYEPKVKIEIGMKSFIEWYLQKNR